MRKKITQRKTVYRTPWFELVAKRVAGEKEPYYAIRTDDYVSVVALTPRREFILVRQFRPAAEKITLELPSGTTGRGESPRATAARELEEETGFRAGRLIAVGNLHSDTGRIMNRLRIYLATGCRPIPGAVREEGLTVALFSPRRMERAIASGAFDHALHVAALGMASRKARLPVRF